MHLWLLRRQFPLLLRQLRQKHRQFPRSPQAPLVGTFYAAPSPDQPPFVQVGDTVKKGDVVLIIESMKLMNEVTSDVDGVVQEILVKNGDAVEYDQPLMILS